MPKRGSKGRAKILTNSGLRPATPVIKGSAGKAKLSKATRKPFRLK